MTKQHQKFAANPGCAEKCVCISLEFNRCSLGYFGASLRSQSLDW